MAQVDKIPDEPIREKESQYSFIKGDLMHAGNTDYLPVFITDEELAKLSGLSRSYWQKSRVKGGGCPFIKIGRSVRYKLSDVELFLETRKVKSTSKAETLFPEKGGDKNGN